MQLHARLFSILPRPIGVYEITTEGNEERRVCDGKAIYQFDYKQKKLKEYPLPKNLQGKAITNGPLPFVFARGGRYAQPLLDVNLLPAQRSRTRSGSKRGRVGSRIGDFHRCK